ncbi:MAG: CopG family transcriptional regulator [Candidatus Goldbacteria bacterium]|nr:CopG family transcriptional regulator [Candidatus Goldiibacteriota bacterium]
MERRIGVITIFISEKSNIQKLNSLLSQYSNNILGRFGLPIRNKKINIITLVVDLNTDELGALTGKIGNIKGMKVKSIMSDFTL